jgi:TrmH family RNA methyltransferase
MLSRNQIKHLNSLRLNKYRKIHREFIAEGNTLVLDLLTSGLEIRAIYALPEWLENNINGDQHKSIQVTELAENDLKKVSGLSTANEVIAVVRIPEWSIDMEDLSHQLVLMLDNIRDPGNLGTIIRTADWFCINNIICSEECVDVYNPKVVQASMGSVARVKVYYENLIEVFGKLIPGTIVYGTFMTGKDLSKTKLRDKGIIIIGNESKGISKKLFPFINEKIGIPAFGESESESLNAAVACSITLYEFRREQKLHSTG